MKHISKVVALGLLSAGLLASCGSIARTAADNTPVSALPLASAQLSGDLNAVAAQSLGAQANASGTLSFSKSFSDFNPSSIPGIVGTPSGLDVPITVDTGSFTCAPTAANITVNVSGLTLTVKDANHASGVSESKSGMNVNVTMSRNADGTYKATGTNATLATLNLNWLKFAPVVVLSGADTPNTVNLSLNVTVDGVTLPCQMKLTLSPTLKQNVRFQ